MRPATEESSLSCYDARVGANVFFQQVRHTDISTDCARAPAQVRLPPQTFRRMTPKRIANSARQLVASRPGWYRKVDTCSICPHRCSAKRSLASLAFGGKTRGATLAMK